MWSFYLCVCSRELCEDLTFLVSTHHHPGVLGEYRGNEWAYLPSQWSRPSSLSMHSTYTQTKLIIRIKNS